jgi:hypothetical protein
VGVWFLLSVAEAEHCPSPGRFDFVQPHSTPPTHCPESLIWSFGSQNVLLLCLRRPVQAWSCLGSHMCEPPPQKPGGVGIKG